MTGIERTDRKSSRYWRGPKMWGVPSRLVGEPLLPGARVTAPHLDPWGLGTHHRRSAGLLSHLDGGRRPARTDALVGQCRRPDALLAVEHRPADVFLVIIGLLSVPPILLLEFRKRAHSRLSGEIPPNHVMAAVTNPSDLPTSFVVESGALFEVVGGTALICVVFGALVWSSAAAIHDSAGVNGTGFFDGMLIVLLAAFVASRNIKLFVQHGMVGCVGPLGGVRACQLRRPYRDSDRKAFGTRAAVWECGSSRYSTFAFGTVVTLLRHRPFCTRATVCKLSASGCGYPSISSGRPAERRRSLSPGPDTHDLSIAARLEVRGHR